MRALKTDFGPRATLEGAIVELIPRLQSIHYMIAHLGNCWANVRRYQVVEAISQRLEMALAPLMFGRLSGYGATEAKTVAKFVF
ncbi:hypothetical protein MSKU15_0670 [Komagataeibacter diospyri]|uniref:hypothetical protein n=1 Tax=Komagataeibacter diospyri TaxID=1932662 RepID=UPI001134F4D7|nr:hypothetical protein [Komagataeibacter diospyri]GCE89069.1 hypothetical protein MSKU15_0670 [Komagataeibacter diospyri]